MFYHATYNDADAYMQARKEVNEAVNFKGRYKDTKHRISLLIAKDYSRATLINVTGDTTSSYTFIGERVELTVHGERGKLMFFALKSKKPDIVHSYNARRIDWDWWESSDDQPR